MGPLPPLQAHQQLRGPHQPHPEWHLRTLADLAVGGGVTSGQGCYDSAGPMREVSPSSCYRLIEAEEFASAILPISPVHQA